HRRRYALYDSGELADKTEYDCKNSSPADDPDTEYPRYCQHPDVFPVSRCRRSADYGCEHRRHTITDQCAAQPPILEEIPSDNFVDNHLMADLLTRPYQDDS